MGVVGFYTLSSYALRITDLPKAIAQKLSRHELAPAALIGGLAQDARVRGHGVEELLLADALRRVLGAMRTLSVFALLVDAKTNRAATFYKAYGFEPFPSQPLRLFLPISVALKAIERIGPLEKPRKVEIR